MLQLKQTYHIALPQITFRSPAMEFAPVCDEDDELLSDIAQDQLSDDNNWQLTERPDADQLAAFWGTVEADVQKDPEWFNFSNDS